MMFPIHGHARPIICLERICFVRDSQHAALLVLTVLVDAVDSTDGLSSESGLTTQPSSLLNCTLFISIHIDLYLTVILLCRLQDTW